MNKPRASARSGGQLGARQRAGEHEPAGLTRRPFATRPATAAREPSERLPKRPRGRGEAKGGTVNMPKSVSEDEGEGKLFVFTAHMMT